MREFAQRAVDLTPFSVHGAIGVLRDARYSDCPAEVPVSGNRKRPLLEDASKVYLPGAAAAAAVIICRKRQRSGQGRAAWYKGPGLKGAAFEAMLCNPCDLRAALATFGQHPEAHQVKDQYRFLHDCLKKWRADNHAMNHRPRPGCKRKVSDEDARRMAAIFAAGFIPITSATGAPRA
ncbi:hypothetical protein COCSUDRAFT_61181 [Coccomyxa subellipsoidea C-169]|uniref:Uncharacterized protein n=1 Tax=Coccomyxa subellipsoidea (strain C-169) TaxID=574566 RepID=I0Z6C5_COCSC|nr:hypothetical protein COCSUDRAFT_61181 [Coccomyxa subellipsoidea C-169]EIE26194.1 hypothetical protein COCSUDRAFT_61181 [Coccomyxa subellipsoidea C-169]|eukprot:XP_005650738.1 hypothetical protein COCSUDRAFT_61181 [Coccomyxa subellipsoidea C-169]